MHTCTCKYSEGERKRRVNSSPVSLFVRRISVFGAESMEGERERVMVVQRFPLTQLWSLLSRLKRKSQKHRTIAPPLRRRMRQILPPVREGPDSSEAGIQNSKGRGYGLSFGQWIKGGRLFVSRAPSVDSLMPSQLVVEHMGAPLASAHISANPPLRSFDAIGADTPLETLFAQYIIQQYTAASGGQELQNSIRSAFAVGKVKMLISKFETAHQIIKNHYAAESGEFVLWQMDHDKWYFELVVGAHRVHSGCNGNFVWSNTPWLGAQSAKGPARPLRRVLQGLDPKTTASMFAGARYVGEKNINGQNCFVLEVSADPQTLRARSECTEEVISHVFYGYFSQKTGLLVGLEDSQFTRIQSSSGDAFFVETTMNSFPDNYKPVKGIIIAHSGHSELTLFSFGKTPMSHVRIRMEEAWTIDEVEFNIPGLSDDCFISPSDLSSTNACESPLAERKSPFAFIAQQMKLAMVEAHDCNINNMMKKMKL